MTAWLLVGAAMAIVFAALPYLLARVAVWIYAAATRARR